MDRYKVAVGGTHNLDMTFNYHLSVLKSPVPFKLGIDITGNLDDFKYKITKCKYKDIFKPAKQAELDSTRKNIRKDIRDAVRKQIEEAAPELGKRLSFGKGCGCMGTLTVPIHPLVIFHIISSRDVFHPLLVVQIPTDRLDNSGFERSFRCPAQFVCNLCRINGITLVMAQTVFLQK